MNSFPIDIFSVIFFGKSSEDTSIYLFFFFFLDQNIYISLVSKKIKTYKPLSTFTMTQILMLLYKCTSGFQ